MPNLTQNLQSATQQFICLQTIHVTRIPESTDFKTFTAKPLSGLLQMWRLNYTQMLTESDQKEDIKHRGIYTCFRCCFSTSTMRPKQFNLFPQTCA